MAWDKFGYQRNPITGELDTYGYIPQAQEGLKAQNGWAQQVPPEILQRLLSGDIGGSIADPATGMTYHVAPGQDGKPQYVFAEDGHAAPGRQYPQYDLAGNYMGAGTGAAPTSIAVPLAAALAMATMGGSLAGTGLGGAEGATGATAGGLDSANGVLNSAVMNGAGSGGATAAGAGAAGATQTMGAAGAGGAPAAAGAAGADGGWGLTNAVVNGGAGTDLSGMAAAGTGATVLPAAGNGLLDALGGAKALVGPAASLIGGAYAANAAKNAAATQAASADKALGLQKDMFDKVISLNEPFREGGVAGMNALQIALGLKPGDNSGWAMKDFTPSDLTTDPSYQWRLSQGMDALDRASAAHGRFDSGRTMKDITNYAQGAASQEYGNAFNRFQTQRAAKLAPLQSLAGVGQTAAGTVGNAAQNYGSNAANLITGAGNANAAGTVGSANAWTNAIGQGLSSYQNNNLMDLLLKREQNRTGATNGY